MRLLMFLPFVCRSQACRLIHTFAPKLEHKCESRFLGLSGLAWSRSGPLWPSFRSTSDLFWTICRQTGDAIFDVVGRHSGEVAGGAGTHFFEPGNVQKVRRSLAICCAPSRELGISWSASAIHELALELVMALCQVCA